MGGGGRQICPTRGTAGDGSGPERSEVPTPGWPEDTLNFNKTYLTPLAQTRKYSTVI